jgi:Ca2+-binding RTX toxin-like protein
MSGEPKDGTSGPAGRCNPIVPLLLALTLLLLVPAVAPAATATLETYRSSADTPHNPDYTAGTVTVTAAAGETNTLTITAVEGGVEAHDAGAPLQPGPGCTAIDTHRVRCVDEAALRISLRVSAGDGDDAIAVSSAALRPISTHVSGEDGHDTIDLSSLTAAGLIRLDGGPGDDRLTGSSGDDMLVLSPGRDVLDGGPAFDRVTNADQTSITADLGAGTASRVDGTSTLMSIDRVDGTPSADRLIGGPGPDHLAGGGGDDFLDGGGGDDRLFGDDPTPAPPYTLGRDVLLGGEGKDVLDARGAGDRLDAGPGDDVLSPGYTGLVNPRDRAACGPGRDLVSFTGPAALLRDCERVYMHTALGNQVLDLRPASAGTGWSVGLSLQCDDSTGVERCPTTISLREAKPPGQRLGTLIARRRLIVLPRGDDRPTRVRMSLGPRGAALLRRHGGRLSVLVHVRLPFDQDSWDDAYATVAIGR